MLTLIWAAENDLCLNPAKSQANVIGNDTLLYESEELTIKSRLGWDDQINIVCRQVYFTLKHLWTTAGTRILSLVNYRIDHKTL
jgi:hypothetical protein